MMMITHTQAALTFNCTSKVVKTVNLTFNSRFSIVATISRFDNMIEVWPIDVSAESNDQIYFKSPNFQIEINSKFLDVEQDEFEILAYLNSRKIQLSCYSRGQIAL